MKRPGSISALLISFVLVTVTYFAVQHMQKINSASNSPVAPSNSVDSGSGSQVDSSSNQAAVDPSSSVHVSAPQALALYRQGYDLYKERRFSEALTPLNQALAIDPQCYEALNVKGATLAFQGYYDEGLALIQQALELNPFYVYGHFNLGLANELAERYDAAIAAYQKAIQLDARDTWSYYGIASIYGRQGNVDKVLEYLPKAIALEPDAKAVARDEKDFAPVRDDPRFQALVKP